MKKLLVCSIVVFSILVGSVSCTIDDDNPVTCVELEQNLESLRISIKDFAAAELSSFVGRNFSEQNHLINYDKKSLRHRI